MEGREKLFKTGGSQAVRLPVACRFHGQTEVLTKREGRRVVLEAPRAATSQRFLDLAGSAADFPYPDEPLGVDEGPQLD
jgi:virulence-associated protein VagC